MTGISRGDLRSRFGVALMFIATIGLLLLPRPTEGVEPVTSPHRQFWGTFAVAALDIEPAGSLEEVIANSDAVILGQVVRVTAGRMVGEPSAEIPGSQVLFANITVAVIDVLAGHLPPEDRSQLTLEILFPGRTAFDELSAVSGLVPPTPSVLFLRNNASTAAAMGHSLEIQERERPYYHLTVQRAVLADEAGRTVAPVWTDRHDFFSVLEGQVFSSIVDELRQR